MTYDFATLSASFEQAFVRKDNDVLEAFLKRDDRSVDVIVQEFLDNEGNTKTLSQCTTRALDMKMSMLDKRIIDIKNAFDEHEVTDRTMNINFSDCYNSSNIPFIAYKNFFSQMVTEKMGDFPIQTKHIDSNNRIFYIDWITIKDIVNIFENIEILLSDSGAIREFKYLFKYHHDEASVSMKEITFSFIKRN